MPFLDELNVTLLKGTELVELDEPLRYKTTWGSIITIPSGFVSDLASIPKVFQSIFSKLGKHKRAAVLHDFLYKDGRYFKELADILFLRAMIDDDVSAWKRSTMYWAVKHFGWKAWKRHREND